MWTLAKPCLQEGFAKADPAVLESVHAYVDAAHECTVKTKDEAAPEEQKAKFEACMKAGPARPNENIDAVCLVQRNH